MKIGFDLDKVFIDTPPLVPAFLIDFLYKKHDGEIQYKIPGKLEKQIRILSHIPFLRPRIKENILALERSGIDKKETYIISSRFSFLEQRTEQWIKNNGLSKYFNKMYFNFNNEQPHLFKERVIREEKIEKFVDDDLDTLLYLSKKIPKNKFYWVSRNYYNSQLPENIVRIKNLDEFFEKYV